MYIRTYVYIYLTNSTKLVIFSCVDKWIIIIIIIIFLMLSCCGCMIVFCCCCIQREGHYQYESMCVRVYVRSCNNVVTSQCIMYVIILFYVHTYIGTYVSIYTRIYNNNNTMHTSYVSMHTYDDIFDKPCKPSYICIRISCTQVFLINIVTLSSKNSS